MEWHLLEKALQLLVEMQRKGLVQEVITYGALISACAMSEDNAEMSLQLLVERQREGLVQKVFTYGSLINARRLLTEWPCMSGQRLRRH